MSIHCPLFIDTPELSDVEIQGVSAMFEISRGKVNIPKDAG
jgi:hypothetical protein